MGDVTLDADTAFDLLSNERRRRLLCLLARRGEEVSLQSAAEALVDDAAAGDDRAYRSVYVSLYQNHVPRLAEAGVVEFDDDERRVELAHTPRTRVLLSLLDAEFEDRWRTAYLTSVAVAGAVGVGGYLQVVPSPSNPVLLPGVVLVASLASIGLHQYYTRDRIAVDGCGDADVGG